MAHPYKSQADSSHASKAGTMGKTGNLDMKTMKGAGENNSKKLYSSSSSSMQFKGQSSADGMKRGGHVKKHAKPMVAIAGPANPPSLDPALAAAGAGSSPAPAPSPAAPPMAPPMKIGGMVSRRGGGDSGVGRLEKVRMIKGKMKPIKG